MNILNGSTRGSHITGESVHNQRIERMWRDVHKEVTGCLYQEFYGLEDAGLLSPDNEIDRYVLHCAYLPEINARLTMFQKAWNSHRLRTENNRTPQQIWLDGMLLHQQSNRLSINAVFGDGEAEPLTQRLQLRFRNMTLKLLGLQTKIKRSGFVKQPISHILVINR